MAIKEPTFESVGPREIIQESKDGAAEIAVEKLFRGGENITTIDNYRIERVDDDMVAITVDGTKMEFVLPISIVRQIIPSEKGNPGSVEIKEGWAYIVHGVRSEDDYRKILKDFTVAGGFEGIDSGGTRNTFSDGLPERIRKGGSLAVESGYRAHFGDGNTFRTMEEAIKKAKEIANSAKNLDVPSLDSKFGKITPRELALLKNEVNEYGSQPNGWDNENGPTVDDWLDSAQVRDLQKWRDSN